MSQHSAHWKRAILLMDLNAFFASVEQLDCPELRGRPVAVTNGQQGTCIITCSYEARQYGIKTGMRIYDAKRLCPHLVQCPARPQRYAQLSTRIMTALEVITPDIEIFSIDEAFLDVTRCQRLWGQPEKMARRVKTLVYEETGLLCSVGLSGDKTTAKYAAKQDKPDGLTVIAPTEAAQRLANVPVTQLCGIAKGIGRFLAQHGVFVCGDMKKIPIEVLSRRYGAPGRRIWYMAQGRDSNPVAQHEAEPKSVGHGKVLPPGTNTQAVIAVYLRHMAEKVAARLRRHHLKAQKYFIGLRTPAGYIGEKLRLERPDNDGKAIYQLCLFVLNEHWQGEKVWQVQVTALDPQSGPVQLDLFSAPTLEKTLYHQAIDQVNARFGHYTIAPAALLQRSRMPHVIAPAWRPSGIRNTV